MKNVKLFIYNYGISDVANFKDHFHEAMQCMKAMNDGLVKTYGALPEKIFYYLSYQTKKSKNVIYYVNTSNESLGIADRDTRIKLIS